MIRVFGLMNIFLGTISTLIEIGGKGKTMTRNFRVRPHYRDQGLIGIRMLI